MYIPGRGPGDEALYSSATGGDRKYRGQLYVDGDHTVSVFLNRNAARQEQVANFDWVESDTGEVINRQFGRSGAMADRADTPQVS